MNTPVRRTVSARAASETLTAALIALGARGMCTPCSQPETHHYWLSEIEAERKQAAAWCRPCPVLIECGQAAEAHDERWGVWASKDYSRKPGKKISAA
jgi:Transcription factor WhiB